MSTARLDELLAAATRTRVVDAGRAGGPANTVIGRVHLDSRTLEPGDLLVVRTEDLTEAIARIRGAAGRGLTAALVSEALAAAIVESGAVPPAVVILASPEVAADGSRMAERLVGDPSRRLDLLAVTGTNGKTTTAWLLQRLLAAEAPTGLIGTIVADDGRHAEPAVLTTPDGPTMSGLLARMAANDCRAAVCEASSHGLEQGRLDGMRIATAIFTNLSGDHLDYHGSVGAYVAAKRRLFERLHSAGTAIVNADDPRSADMIAASNGAHLIRVSERDPSAEVLVRMCEADASGSQLVIESPWGRLEARCPVPGRFNAMNAAQALAGVASVGGDVVAAAGRLGSVSPPPGRLEPVAMPTGADPADLPTVLVDYAHTDDALDRMLAAVRSIVPAGRKLSVVFGCGGDRDRTKRPRMGAAVGRHADVVVVTSDNPRTEDPERIIDDVWPGLPDRVAESATREADRAAAIERAVSTASGGDVVVIAGKGHERDQDLGDRRIPFDDVTVAAASLARRTPSGRRPHRKTSREGVVT